MSSEKNDAYSVEHDEQPHLQVPIWPPVVDPVLKQLPPGMELDYRILSDGWRTVLPSNAFESAIKKGCSKFTEHGLANALMSEETDVLVLIKKLIKPPHDVQAQKL
ncbi:hypothetical protein FOMG_17332 [Fusarium oxysporum f. sp. melonis 26406]|uniref:Uncharacterized protein n=1 Tax=Fusarium oxysporum f. sp. melonis 26406 TaxID=1089452 RepID=W9ZCT0_FUSOX|nr:hypothetical protein FOMG_17332 [Fusarium oxysporum f. sp. melonis 26406]